MDLKSRRRGLDIQTSADLQIQVYLTTCDPGPIINLPLLTNDARFKNNDLVLYISNFNKFFCLPEE